MRDNFNKRKSLILSILGVFILIVAIGGITFAFFNYTRTGTANTFSVGRISFTTNQTNTITLTNLFPINPAESGIMDDTTKVGTFTLTIEGDTDYSGGVEYLISSVNANNIINGTTIPISLDVEITDLGTPNSNYFTARESTNSSIYKKMVGGDLLGNQMLLVGYIAPNTTPGTAEGISGSITIKAYLDKNKILISDTYDGTESNNMGTTNEKANGKTVLTTTEWNSYQQTGISFQVRVEANEGIWVEQTLSDIMMVQNINTLTGNPIMDNENSTYVQNATPGIDFSQVSSDTNGKGIYMRAGTENDAYPVVYYRGDVANNNVLFANKCWQAVRTTDTGGVKLLYNGEYTEKFELNPLIGESSYSNVVNTSSNPFTFNTTDNTWDLALVNGIETEISFTVPAGDDYVLVLEGIVESSFSHGTTSFYKDGVLVKSYHNVSGESINMMHEFGTLNSSNVIKVTYSAAALSSTTANIKLKMTTKGDSLGFNCDNSGIDSLININGKTDFAFSDVMNSPAYLGYMYGTVYEAQAAGNLNLNTKYFGTGFEYGNFDGVEGNEYRLVGEEVGYAMDRKYSCGATSANATCETIKYYYRIPSLNPLGNSRYIYLSNGESVEDALEKMQVNTANSNAKTTIDSWYTSNMASYTSKLEDTIWCNDRSVSDLGEWDPQGETTGGIAANLGWRLYYSGYKRAFTTNEPNLSCMNKNDAFTVNNMKGNKKLTYPVAMLTADELTLAGAKAGSVSTFYATNSSVYSMTPGYYDTGTSYNFILAGSLKVLAINYTYGLRPSISLKAGTQVESGTGTIVDPFIIK